MSSPTLKYYQVGSFAVGNRLVPPELRSVQSEQERSNAITSGHRACRGCGEALGARYVLDTALEVARGRLVVVNATGCLEVFSTPYPESAWRVPWLHSLFGNTAAVATGVARALRAQGREDVRVVAQAGDGGTVDIGLGCLSGMFERNDDVLYVCYDNGGYMNTGVQRSGATPATASTTTTPAVGEPPGNPFGSGKDLPAIALAHGIPFVATATVADLRDLEAKVRASMHVRGARYLHVLVPCPLGWGADADRTVALARLATRSGLFPVWRGGYGEVLEVTKIRQPVPVEDYLREQGRFGHLFRPHRREDLLAAVQAQADATIARYGLRGGAG